MSIRRHTQRLAIAAVLGLTAPVAFADLISVQGGTAHATTGNNDILGAGVSGIVGGDIYLEAPASLTFTYLGKEAGWNNTMSVTGSVGNGSFNTGTSLAGGSFTVESLSGLLDFVLQARDGIAGLVANGANALAAQPGFFVQQLLGDSIIVAFDDGGAGPDSDYDDLVFRIDAARLIGTDSVSVPEPGSLALLGAGLFGMALRRRRSH